MVNNNMDMDPDYQEKISALMDGELQDSERRQLLDEMRNNPALRDCWSRYRLISDAVHKNLPEQVSPSLHQRISLSLQDEPVIMAPRFRTLPSRGLAKQLAGLAIAASVTAVAILGIQQLNRDEAAGGPALATASIPQAQQAALTSYARVADAAPMVQLGPYLVNHNEYSVSSGMHGVLPYVRIVSQRNNK